MCNHDYIFAVELVPMASKQESWDFHLETRSLAETSEFLTIAN